MISFLTNVKMRLLLGPHFNVCQEHTDGPHSVLRLWTALLSVWDTTCVPPATAAKYLFLSHPLDEKLEFISPPIEAVKFLSNLLNLISILYYVLYFYASILHEDI